MWYMPNEKYAYYSILFIKNYVYFGNSILIIHKISSDILILFTIIHILLLLKICDKKTWTTGILLLYIIILLIFTGYLLRWDYIGYNSVKVASNLIRDVPLIGKYIKRILLSGEDISEITLIRYYFLHILVFPIISYIIFKYHISNGFGKFFEKDLGLIMISMGILICISTLNVYESISIEEGKGMIKPYWLFIWIYTIDYIFGNINPSLNFIPGTILLLIAIYLLVFPYVKDKNEKFGYFSLIIILTSIFILSLIYFVLIS